MTKLLIINIIFFISYKCFAQVPFYFKEIIGNNLAISMKEEADCYSFCVREFNTRDSSTSYFFHISKDAKNIEIDTLKKNVFNSLQGFESINDSLYAYLLHLAKIGNAKSYLEIYKGKHSKELKAITSILLPDTLSGFYFKIYQQVDSIIYFAYFTKRYGPANFCSINLNTRKIQSIHYPELQLGPVSIALTFDNDNYIIKGIQGIQIISVAELKSKRVIYDILFGDTAGEIKKWDGNNLFINTGSQLVDMNLSDPYDTFDFGVSLIKPDFTFYKNTTFGKPGDTIDMPAIVKSIAIGKDYFLFGGTSNFQTFSWPIGFWSSWFMVAKTDTALNLNWVKYYGGDAYYVMMGIDETSDGSIIAYGYRYDYSNPNSDMDVYIIKLSKSGDIVFTKNFPLKTKRVKLYPNPATDVLIISTPEDCKVYTFTLTDIHGKEVIKKLILTPCSTISIDIASIPAGVYVCSIFISGSNLYQNETIILK